MRIDEFKCITKLYFGDTFSLQSLPLWCQPSCMAAMLYWSIWMPCQQQGFSRDCCCLLVFVILLTTMKMHETTQIACRLSSICAICHKNVESRLFMELRNFVIKIRRRVKWASNSGSFHKIGRVSSPDNINCNGLKTAKIIKRWYYSASHWHLGNVMVGNIVFLIIFAVFVNIMDTLQFLTFLGLEDQ